MSALSIPLAIRHYCSYQERAHSEVRNKLLELGARGLELEQYIMELINEDYLNEERFAIAFAGGKFRLLGWGKVKIKQALRAKAVSDYCINKALNELDNQGYEEKLQQLAEKKLSTLRTGTHLAKQKKLQDYLLSKGYESNLVYKLAKELCGRR
jgi:regulatory protein